MLRALEAWYLRSLWWSGLPLFPSAPKTKASFKAKFASSVTSVTTTAERKESNLNRSTDTNMSASARRSVETPTATNL
jgi:hypothetical protein